ncbi:hypothetical protein Poli38472_006248 [Pythium oligandrum]|uniref:Uncharacterized protein n=1 Tax=Pythium oligandrum TaxID=41045 RepID=A0A8K1CU85_PYTOL|nr:hypothetical protein Poli38472_006248 [Pythium oligandrum]|eukprot:TMW68780.1 hypothetical protein Poli38472_006248 [Pythium oligandrum]
MMCGQQEKPRRLEVETGAQHSVCDLARIFSRLQGPLPLRDPVELEREQAHDTLVLEDHCGSGRVCTRVTAVDDERQVDAWFNFVVWFILFVEMTLVVWPAMTACAMAKKLSKVNWTLRTTTIKTKIASRVVAVKTSVVNYVCLTQLWLLWAMATLKKCEDASMVAWNSSCEAFADLVWSCGYVLWTSCPLVINQVKTQQLKVTEGDRVKCVSPKRAVVSYSDADTDSESEVEVDADADSTAVVLERALVDGSVCAHEVPPSNSLPREGRAAASMMLTLTPTPTMPLESVLVGTPTATVTPVVLVTSLSMTAVHVMKPSLVTAMDAIAVPMEPTTIVPSLQAVPVAQALPSTSTIPSLLSVAPVVSTLEATTSVAVEPSVLEPETEHEGESAPTPTPTPTPTPATLPVSSLTQEPAVSSSATQKCGLRRLHVVPISPQQSARPESDIRPSTPMAVPSATPRARVHTRADGASALSTSTLRKTASMPSPAPVRITPSTPTSVNTKRSFIRRLVKQKVKPLPIKRDVDSRYMRYAEEEGSSYLARLKESVLRRQRIQETYGTTNNVQTRAAWSK